MAYLFGDGENFQGSYFDSKENLDWYLDFGEIDLEEQGFKYKKVGFYRSDRKNPKS